MVVQLIALASIRLTLQSASVFYVTASLSTIQGLASILNSVLLLIEHTSLMLLSCSLMIISAFANSSVRAVCVSDALVSSVSAILKALSLILPPSSSFCEFFQPSSCDAKLAV